MNDLQVRETTTQPQIKGINRELFSSWIRYIDAKPKTVETYSRAVKQFYIYLQSRGIIYPTRDDVLSYRDYLDATKKPTTTQAYLQAVKLFFEWTELTGQYPNIARRVKGKKLTKDHKKDALTTKQASELIQSIDRSDEIGKRDYAIILLMLTGGLRTIEVVRANVEDFRALGDFMVLYLQGKGRDDKSDYVKITEPVEKAIRDYLAYRENKDASSPLFSSTANRNRDGRLTTRSVSRIVKDRLKGIGLDSSRLTAHSLRHTSATLSLLNGGTLEETKQFLRHQNIETTMIYVHALDRLKNKSEERVSEALFSKEEE